MKKLFFAFAARVFLLIRKPLVILVRLIKYLNILSAALLNISDRLYKKAYCLSTYKRPVSEIHCKKVVYTVLTGKYDNLYTPVYYDKSWDYICFCDNHELIKIGHPFWKIFPFESKIKLLTAKSRLPKLLAHKFLPDYEYSIYIDANIQIVSKEIFSRAHNLIKNSATFAISKHFSRDCIYSEAIACLKSGKENFENIKKVLEFLIQENFPFDFGLWENNIIFRKHNDPVVIQLMNAWWQILKDFSYRDQLSLAYILWKFKFKPEIFFKKPVRYCFGDLIFYEHLNNQRAPL